MVRRNRHQPPVFVRPSRHFQLHPEGLPAVTDMTEAHRAMARAMAPSFSRKPVADLSDIPDEAVEAAHDISWGGEQVNRQHIRLMLAAALPVLNTARDAETEAMRTELEQHRSGESYEIGENYGRTTQANSCVRDLLEAVYPGDPMPDRPLDTVWNHLLERVRVDSADVDRWRALRLEPLGMEIGSPDEAYVQRIRERLTDWFNVRAEQKLCVCGEPTTLNTVHRADAPCYVAEVAASLRGEQ